jgi:hypothetical protein
VSKVSLSCLHQSPSDPALSLVALTPVDALVRSPSSTVFVVFLFDFSSDKQLNATAQQEPTSTLNKSPLPPLYRYHQMPPKRKTEDDAAEKKVRHGLIFIHSVVRSRYQSVVSTYGLTNDGLPPCLPLFDIGAHQTLRKNCCSRCSKGRC